MVADYAAVRINRHDAHLLLVRPTSPHKWWLIRGITFQSHNLALPISSTLDQIYYLPATPAWRPHLAGKKHPRANDLLFRLARSSNRRMMVVFGLRSRFVSRWCFSLPWSMCAWSSRVCWSVSIDDVARWCRVAWRECVCDSRLHFIKRESKSSFDRGSRAAIHSPVVFTFHVVFTEYSHYFS